MMRCKYKQVITDLRVVYCLCLVLNSAFVSTAEDKLNDNSLKRLWSLSENAQQNLLKRNQERSFTNFQGFTPIFPTTEASVSNRMLKSETVPSFKPLNDYSRNLKNPYSNIQSNLKTYARGITIQNANRKSTYQPKIIPLNSEVLNSSTEKYFQHSTPENDVQDFTTERYVQDYGTEKYTTTESTAGTTTEGFRPYFGTEYQSAMRRSSRPHAEALTQEEPSSTFSSLISEPSTQPEVLETTTSTNKTSYLDPSLWARSITYDDDDDSEEDSEENDDDDDSEEDEATKEKRGTKIKKKYKKYMLPLLLAYKLKFFTLVPLMMGGLVLLAGSTGLAGFFFALFAATMGLKTGGH